MGSCDRKGCWSAGDSNNAVAFILGMSVLMGLISSTPQPLGVSLTLIMIYIKKNRYLNAVSLISQRGFRTWD